MAIEAAPRDKTPNRDQPSAVLARQAQITQWLAEEGRLDVLNLADRLGVAQETVRRDLRSLEAHGRLQRVHGGAVPVENDAFPAPALAASSDDQTFAQKLWARLPRSGAILLGTGRLTSALVSAIADDPPPEAGLTVVSNSLDAAIAAARIPQLSVYNIGGAVSASTRAQEGDWALQELERLQVDVSVVCPAGLGPECGLGQATPAAAAVSQAEVACGRKVIAVAEARLLDRPAFVRFATWREIDTLLVSGNLDEATHAAYVDRGIDIEVVDTARAGASEGAA